MKINVRPLSVILLFLFASFAQSSAPAPDTYTVQVQTNVRVKMRDGISLVCDIYRPQGEGKFPIVMTRTPYNRKDPATGMFIASHGYIAIL